LSQSADGVLRAGDLGAEVGWARSRLCHQISRMEKRGLLACEACVDDARGFMVRTRTCGKRAEAGFRSADTRRGASFRDFLDRIPDAVERNAR